MIVNLLLITLIIVFIIDLSGIIDSIETVLSKFLNGKARVPKPFSCSLCMTWWVGLIYLLCIHQFTLIWISIVALFAFLTPVFSAILVWIRETLIWVVDKAYNALK